MLSLVQFRGSIHRVSTLRPDAVVSAKGRASHGGASHPPPGRIYGTLVRAPRAKPCLSAALLPVFGGRGCPRTSCAGNPVPASQKVPLYGASNGILAIQQARLEKANLTTYFSGLFVSDKIGAEKPDPRFFTFCLQRSGFPCGRRIDGRRQLDRRYSWRLLCGYGWLLVPPPHSAPSCQHHFAPRHH